MKKYLAVVLSFYLALFSSSYSNNFPVALSTPAISFSASKDKADPSLDLSASSVLLMDAATQTVLYEKDAHTILPPASITKIMTLILIFDALEKGQITLSDPVTTSPYAASMGGSQVFLEAGEQQDVQTLIKCICVASANDACVTMAEYINGSEDAFVTAMNERAKGLGMKDTTFVNCCGLDTKGHLTSAYDVALMSCELLLRYPKILEYTSIWQEDITHHTARKDSTFTLTNTNRLIRQYPLATGLKTGSTSQAGFCLSATARKDDLDLIAVVLGCPDPKSRIRDCITLLDYGFATCKLYKAPRPSRSLVLPVERGTKDQISLYLPKTFQYLDTRGRDLAKIKCRYELPDLVHAPVKKGKVAGYIHYFYDKEELGKVPLCYKESVEHASFMDCLFQLLGLL